MFQRLLCLGSIPVTWKVANVTPIPKSQSTFLLSGQLQTNFLNTYTVIRYLSIWYQFILGSLWNAEVCFQPSSLLIGKVVALVMPFCMWHTPYIILLRLGRKQELFRYTTVTLLTASIIRGSFSNSALWELEVLCCQFRQFLSNQSQYVRWMVIRANWLMWCQECLRELFWVYSCSTCTPWSFSLYWKESFVVMLTAPPS